MSAATSAVTSQPEAMAGEAGEQEEREQSLSAVLDEQAQQAFAAFYLQMRASVQSVVRRLVADPLAAEDVEGEAWLALARNWHSVQTKSAAHARNYAATAARRKAIDYLRHHSVQTNCEVTLTAWANDASSMDDADPLERLVAAGEQVANALTPERLVVARDEWQELLARCGTSRAALVVAAYAAGYTHADIASMLDDGATVSAVKMVLARTLAKLRDTSQPAS